ncbi:MAG: hypothetical protein WKF37_21040 [Bryobacteraceae bacterium]
MNSITGTHGTNANHFPTDPTQMHAPVFHGKVNTHTCSIEDKITNVPSTKVVHTVELIVAEILDLYVRTTPSVAF